MYIKCCGIQTKAALEACEKYQADAVGFIHYPKSKRHLTIKQLHQLLAIDISIDKVAVMVNPSIKSIESILTTGINVIQLHGDESPEYIKDIQHHFNHIRLFKALPATSNLKEVISQYETCGIERYIIDTPSTQYGGTGRTFDWELLHQLPTDIPYLIAGGLTLSYIQEIQNIGYTNEGYDISSGIETDGYKDINKIKNLLTTLKG